MTMKNIAAALALVAVSGMVGCSDKEQQEEKGSPLANQQQNAKTKEAASAMTIFGRNLFIAITQANVDRECHGLASAWPHTSEENGLSEDAEDIAGKKFSSANEYFKALFDVGGDSPYVIADQSNAMSNGKSLWNVAQGVLDEASDNVPVLISANFDCSVLPGSWTGSESGADKLISIGSFGAMGDSGIVVIYKGGKAEFLKKSEVTLRNILGRGPIDGMPQSWLTPDGVVSAK